VQDIQVDAIQDRAIGIGCEQSFSRSPYPLDHALGLHYTDTLGTDGRLREFVEGFIVEELSQKKPQTTFGNHVVFTLEKKNWETTAAVKRMTRALGVSYRRFRHAGNKDKRALTKQRVSA
jgi:tRNA pseudouridine13 synthase